MSQYQHSRANREKSVSASKVDQLWQPFSGFTLIELLAVMAVVGMIATLLLPVLSHSKEAARRSVCLNNLRQFSVAAAAYSADNQGSVPSFLDWLYAIPGPSAKSHDVVTGSLYDYLKNKQVYLCPTDKLALTSSGAAARSHPALAKRDYSYAMNCVLCHQRKPSTFFAPDKTLLWLEANLEPADFTGMAGPVAGPSAMRVTKAIATRHRDSGHLLFADLHVTRVSEKKAARLVESKRFWLPTDDDPFYLSPSLADP